MLWQTIMTLLALGINHETASVALRERVVFSSEIIGHAIESLLAQPQVQGGVVLSTCNRTELYLSVGQKTGLQDRLVAWLCDYHNVSEEQLRASLYWHYGDDAVSHLMRVASGLDSQILGEPQILGQLKRAWARARSYQTHPGELDRLFQKTFSVAKRVRSETDIGSSAVSVVFAACTLARQIFESLATATVLLVGAGETIELAARHLRQHRTGKLIIANRTPGRGQKLAGEMSAEAISLMEIGSRLAEADIIISSTASSTPIINKAMVERALKVRRNQPMLLIDIAVPRDIEEGVGRLANTYLYNVDDIQGIINNNMAQRQAAARKAEEIVHRERDEFMSWLRAQSVTETIRDYREQADQVRHELEKKALMALAQGIDPQIVLSELAHKLTRRLIHQPTCSLQQAGRDGDMARLHMLRASLGLD